MKYILLYNLPDELNNDQMANKIKKAIPSTKILNFSLFNDGSKAFFKQSIWVPEEYYMIALTIANYEYLLDISFCDLESEITADYLINWFEKNRNNENFVKYDL